MGEFIIITIIVIIYLVSLTWLLLSPFFQKIMTYLMDFPTEVSLAEQERDKE